MEDLRSYIEKKGYRRVDKELSVEFEISRVLDHIGIENELVRRWHGKARYSKAWKI